MPDGQKKPLRLDAAMLRLLACPVCRSALRMQDEHLVCAQCGRAYPVRDGIPALIAERAQ